MRDLWSRGDDGPPGRGASSKVIFKGEDVIMTQLKLLHVLVECETEISVKELAEQLAMSLPNASRTVDHLLGEAS